MPFVTKRRGTQKPRLAMLLWSGWFLALLGSKVVVVVLAAVASSPTKIVVVVVDRPLVRISYSELLDVFGDWEDVGASSSNNNNNNNNNKNNKNNNEDSPDDRLATILQTKRDKILPLLSRIEAAFGRTGGQGVCGIGDEKENGNDNENDNDNGNGNENENENDNENDNKDSCAIAAEHPSSTAVSPPSLGFLEVTHVPPEMAALRQRLLPRASELANLPGNELRALERPESGYAIGWSHGKESFRQSNNNNNNNNKSKDENENDDEKGGSGNGETRHYDTAKGSFYVDPFVAESQTHNVFPPSLQPQLEADLLEMTRFMARVGLWIAALCDYYLLMIRSDDTHDDRNGNGNRSGSGNGNGNDNGNDNSDGNGNSEHDWMVTRSLISGRSAAKARLLYYFPREHQEHHPEEEDEERKKEKEHDVDVDVDVDVFDDWCGWHTDHGSLTALLPGMLCGGDDETFPENNNKSRSKSAPDRHKAGLYIKTTRSERRVDTNKNKNKNHNANNDDDDNDNDDDDANDAPDVVTGRVVEELVHVDLAVDSLGFQLGETLEILSGRIFRATSHAVRAPKDATGTGTGTAAGTGTGSGTVATGAFGRASLALFLQPQGSQVLPPLPAWNEANEIEREIESKSESEIEIEHDPLSLQRRWRGTFGEFQKTTFESFR